MKRKALRLSAGLALAGPCALLLALCAPGEGLLNSLPILSLYSLALLSLPSLLFALLEQPNQIFLLLLGARRGGRRRWLWLLLLPALILALDWGARRFLSNRLDLVADAGRFVGLLAGAGLFYLLQRLPLPRLGPAPSASLLTLSLLMVWFGPLTLLFPEWRLFSLPLLCLGIAASLLLWGSHLSPRIQRWALGAGLLLSLISMGGLLILRPGPAAKHPAGRIALRSLRLLLDGDGDGFSAALEGGDCDDQNPQIHPLAIEILKDGLDNNCRGGDLKELPRLPRSTPSLQGSPLDVVLISIDTWRGDCFNEEISPNLDIFAQGGRRFLRAYSAASFTDLSFRALFTGWPPSDFDHRGELLGMDSSLAEILGGLGWRSYALQPLGDLGKLVTLGFQLMDDRFKVLHLDRRGSSAPQITARALSLLKQPSAQPRLVWIHYIEPHRHYLSHPGFEHLGDDRRGRYEQEVAFVDQSMAPLLRWLARPEVSAHTATLIFSDHGEYLGERGRKGHDHSLYNPVVHVPLILRAPGLKPAEVQQPVSLLDLFPTIIELCHIQGVPRRAGYSLLKPRPKEPLLLEARSSLPRDPNIALIQGDWLLHFAERDGLSELFNLQEDPSCLRDLSGTLKAPALELKAALDKRLEFYRNDQRYTQRHQRWIARWKKE